MDSSVVIIPDFCGCSNVHVRMKDPSVRYTSSPFADDAARCDL